MKSLLKTKYKLLLACALDLKNLKQVTYGENIGRKKILLSLK